MRQHLNKLEIHRFTYRQTDKQTNRHLAMCTLTILFRVQVSQNSDQDNQDSHLGGQKNHQANQDSHQVNQEMELSKQEMESYL